MQEITVDVLRVAAIVISLTGQHQLSFLPGKDFSQVWQTICELTLTLRERLAQQRSKWTAEIWLQEAVFQLIRVTVALKRKYSDVIWHQRKVLLSWAKREGLCLSHHLRENYCVLAEGEDSFPSPLFSPALLKCNKGWAVEKHFSHVSLLKCVAWKQV